MVTLNTGGLQSFRLLTSISNVYISETIEDRHIVLHVVTMEDNRSGNYCQWPWVTTEGHFEQVL